MKVKFLINYRSQVVKGNVQMVVCTCPCDVKGKTLNITEDGQSLWSISQYPGLQLLCVYVNLSCFRDFQLIFQKESLTSVCVKQEVYFIDRYL